MRRILIVVLGLVVVAGFMSAQTAVAEGFLQDNTGLVSMEAEHYQSNVSQGGYTWTPVSNAGYSGTGALQVLPNDEPNPLPAGSGPRLDYQVEFTQTGTHYVWIRALAYSVAGDSLYVSIDGGTSDLALLSNMSTDGQTWTWTNNAWGGAETINVTSTGVHTINVWMRESGVVLDKIVLTTNSGYTPSGTGPAETLAPAGNPPTVTTSAATSVGTTGAVLNGSVNPNGLAADGWFEWGTSPTLSTYSSTSAQSLGSGTSSQAISATLSELAAGTTYYFRTAASNSEGTERGSIESFTTSAGGGGGGFLQDNTGLVSMEAEHYQSNVSQGGYTWTPVTNSGHSGTGAMQVLPNDGPNPLPAGSGPRLDYQVEFTQTGTHYVWVRALAYSVAGDSLYVSIDGGTSDLALLSNMSTDGQTWTWTNNAWGGAETINVTSVGVHTINVWMRESGVVLDKIVLTTNSGYTPSGTGPAETLAPAGNPPTVTTSAATSVGTTGAVLNGTVNPNGLAADGWFEWGTSPTLATYSSTSTQSKGSGTSGQSISETLTELAAGTTYYFRVAASNSMGTERGTIASFGTWSSSGQVIRYYYDNVGNITEKTIDSIQ